MLKRDVEIHKSNFCSLYNSGNVSAQLRIINNFGKAGAVIFNALLCRLFCKISPFKAVRQVPNCS